MSLTGSIVIIVVMISRMVMRKLPKKYLYLLWGIVGFRLLCPIALESRFSIFNITPIRNSVENVRDIPLIQYGPGHAGDTVSAAVHHAGTAAGTAQAQMHINITPFILIAVWAAIAVGIVCYIIYKYIVIKHDLNSTTEVKPGVFVGHQVDSPFVMGIIKPRIYMPAGLTESEMEYLTLHEKTHIRRGDVFTNVLPRFFNLAGPLERVRKFFTMATIASQAPEGLMTSRTRKPTSRPTMMQRRAARMDWKPSF